MKKPRPYSRALSGENVIELSTDQGQKVLFRELARMAKRGHSITSVALLQDPYYLEKHIEAAVVVYV